MNNIQWQDDKDLFGRLYVFTNDSVFSQLRNAVDNSNANLSDAFSWGQLKSKRWLVNELENLDLKLGTIFLCAGWYATLATMLFNSKCNLEKIRSFDIDNSCEVIAVTINRNFVSDGWKFKATTFDIHQMKYPLTYSTLRANRSEVELTEMPDTIINTSCEHIENFQDWYNSIPDGKIVVLQTNNYFEIEDHINCSSSLEEFATTTPMTEVLYQGELQLPKYTRFMRIGIK
jgi:hypothetical protein